jgi:hypothetical protein
VKKILFGPLELEMVDLKHFWREIPLGSLGVKILFSPIHHSKPNGASI